MIDLRKRRDLEMRWVLVIGLLAVCSGAGVQSQAPANPSAPCTSFPSIAPAGTATCADVAPKQTAAPESSDSAPAQPESPPRITSQSSSVIQTLDGEPVFEAKPGQTQFLYGGRLIGGYNSAAFAPNSTLQSTGFSTYDGYLGAAVETRRSYFVLQQDFFGNQYTASGLPGQYLFQTSAVAAGEWNTRARWHLEGHSTVGNGALLLISPLPSTSVGQTPAALPNSADVGLDNSLALYPDASAGVSLSVNPRTALVLYAKDSYREIFDNNTHENLALFRPSLLWSMSRRTTIGVYGLSTRETGEIDCRSNGGGLEFSTHFARTGYLDMWGGPQYGSNGCIRNQTFAYHLELAAQAAPNIDTYLIANRESGNTLVSGSNWEDNVAVGIRRRGRSVLLSVDAGYVSGTHLGERVKYQGAFGSVELRKRINNSFLVSGAYRRFDNNETAPALHSNVVLFSLIFSPSRHAHAERQRASGETND